MLNLALVGLMAGSLAVSPTDDGKKGGDAPKADVPPAAAAAGPSIFQASDEAPETIQDQYAFGRQYGGSPLRLWASFAYGEAEGNWGPNGEDAEIRLGAQIPTNNGFTDFDLVSMRVIAGAELGLPVNLLGFGLSAGAQVVMAKNELQVGENPGILLTEDLSSDFGLQKAKFYGEARTNTIGIHGGYLLDIGNEGERNAQTGLPTSLATSDGRNAVNVGASFDYPSPGPLRLFGGVDYYDILDAEGQVEEANDDFMVAMFGLGFRTPVVELGASLQIQTRFNNATAASLGTPGIGSSAATIAPYIRFSPPAFPATLFVKGAVWDEYSEYGLAIGGSNAVKPSIGFTAGLTFGFN